MLLFNDQNSTEQMAYAIFWRTVRNYVGDYGWNPNVVRQSIALDQARHVLNLNIIVIFEHKTRNFSNHLQELKMVRKFVVFKIWLRDTFSPDVSVKWAENCSELRIVQIFKHGSKTQNSSNTIEFDCLSIFS